MECIRLGLAFLELLLDSSWEDTDKIEVRLGDNRAG